MTTIDPEKWLLGLAPASVKEELPNKGIFPVKAISNKGAGGSVSRPNSNVGYQRINNEQWSPGGRSWSKPNKSYPKKGFLIPIKKIRNRGREVSVP